MQQVVAASSVLPTGVDFAAVCQHVSSGARLDGRASLLSYVHPLIHCLKGLIASVAFMFAVCKYVCACVSKSQPARSLYINICEQFYEFVQEVSAQSYSLQVFACTHSVVLTTYTYSACGLCLQRVYNAYC